MNFMIFLCATLKLFFLSSVSLPLAQVSVQEGGGGVTGGSAARDKVRRLDGKSRMIDHEQHENECITPALRCMPPLIPK